MNKFLRDFSHSLEHYLLLAIGSFIFFTLLLFALIIISRLRKSRKEKLTKRYHNIIHEILFNVLFQNTEFSDYENKFIYKRLFTDAFFRQLMIDKIIELRHDYDVEFSKNLETFYFQSHLIHDSFDKLKSRRWEVKCKGIEELAEMHISKCFDVLIKISKSKHKMLKLVALKACITLNGANGLLHLIDHTEPIDEWMQLSIVEAIKSQNLTDTSAVKKLFASKNNYVVALAAKVSQSLKLDENLTLMKEIQASSTDESLSQKLTFSIQKLERINYA